MKEVTEMCKSKEQKGMRAPEQRLKGKLRRVQS